MTAAELNWWELRKVQDMPKKLICKAIAEDEEVNIIQEWDMETLWGYTDKENRKVCSLLAFKLEYGYFPVD